MAAGPAEFEQIFDNKPAEAKEENDQGRDRTGGTENIGDLQEPQAYEQPCPRRHPPQRGGEVFEEQNGKCRPAGVLQAGEGGDVVLVERVDHVKKLILNLKKRSWLIEVVGYWGNRGKKKKRWGGNGGRGPI